MDNPRYKDYLTRLNKWYEKDYVTRDFVALNIQQVLALFDGGKLGAYVDSVDSARIRALKANISIASAPYPRLEEGQQIHTAPATFPVAVNYVETSISSQCRNIPAAVKFLNYAYTKQGSLIYNYGIEGQSYTMVDGEPKFTDLMLNNPDGLTPSSVSYIYKIHAAPKLTVVDTRASPTVVKDPESLAWRLKWADDPNVDNSLRLPPLSLTPEELREYNTIISDINVYAGEMRLRFILGAEPLSKFDDYVAKLYAMKFRRAKEIYQAAYDRLMKEE